MTTQFVSRGKRDVPFGNGNNSQVGPGSYMPPSTLRASIPGFAPFSSSARRVTMEPELDSPSPGAYNTGEDMTRRRGVVSSFKSKTRRFNTTPANSEPGPGDYYVNDGIGKKSSMFNRPRTNPLEIIVNAATRVGTVNGAPSIPSKGQANGYEITNDGGVIPQQAPIPVFSGTRDDSVGPLEYNPKKDVCFRSAPKAVFGKGPERVMLDARGETSSTVGPGTYDVPSSFDLTRSGNDHDFLSHLAASRAKQLSVFESRSSRDALADEIKRRKSLPGPGQYDIKSTIQPKPKPSNQQNFLVSEERFHEIGKSMRVDTAPGSYVRPSEFDEARLKILKHKKMVSRSNWAQNVGFVTTEKRFHRSITITDAPPATAYNPKTTLADSLSKLNPRSGAFGGLEPRFKTTQPPSPTREQHLHNQLNAEISDYLEKKGRVSGGSHESVSFRGHGRPKFSPMFAPSAEDRLRPVKPPVGPPPGSYDVIPKWGTSGAPVMAPVTHNPSSRVEESTPGPGSYNVDSRTPKIRNPRNVMLSTSAREGIVIPKGIPGPGSYNPVPVGSSMLKPSFNILLADSNRHQRHPSP